MLDFKEMAKKKDFSDENYPFADKGVKLHHSMMKVFWPFLIIVFLATGLKITDTFILKVDNLDKAPKIETIEKSKEITKKNQVKKNSTKESPKILPAKKPSFADHFTTYEGKKLDNIQIVQNSLKVILGNLGHWLGYIAWVFLGIFLIYFIRYMNNIIKRQRNYERNVFINDFKANNLRNKIIRSKGYKRRLKEAKNKASKGDSGITHSAMAEIEQLKTLLNMKVNFNTRQSLENDMVETQYRIRYTMPFDSDAAEKVRKETENMDEVATRLARSKITFGKGFISQDRQTLIFRAWTEVEDPYKVESTKSKKDFEVVKVESESSFPLTLLIDKQDEIDMKRDGAQQWANRSAKILDMLLITNKNSTTREKTEVGSANALFTYNLSEDTSIPNFDKLGDTIDVMFKIKGTSASIVDGKLLIALPLPSSLALPINIPSMYKDAFG